MSKFYGHFTAFTKDDNQILWEKKNVELIIGGWLLAWVMASKSISTGSAGGNAPLLVPDYPIWGLAIGTGGNVSDPDDQRKQLLKLKNEIYRKACAFIYFLDPAKYLPSTSGMVSQKVSVPYITPYLEIQTVFNSNTDVILQTNPALTEMGLVGGTTQAYANGERTMSLGGGPVNVANGGILLDYVNPAPFQVPLGRDFVISVVLDFSH